MTEFVFRYKDGETGSEYEFRGHQDWIDGKVQELKDKGIYPPEEEEIKPPYVDSE